MQPIYSLIFGKCLHASSVWNETKMTVFFTRSSSVFSYFWHYFYEDHHYHENTPPGNIIIDSRIINIIMSIIIGRVLSGS